VVRCFSYSAHRIITAPYKLNPLRFYCTGPSTKPIPVDIFQRGLLNIVLPLPNGEKCAFPLYPSKTVNDLLGDIRDEERENSLILLLDEKGNRIPHTTSLAQVIKHPFLISIDDQPYSVLPQDLKTISEHILSSSELRELTLQIYAQRIRTWLLAQEKESIPYEKYLEWCRLYGLSEQQANKLSQALHKTGVILNFHQNEELKGRIYLKADRAQKVLEDCLQLKFLTTHAPVLQKELEQILPLYLPLNEKKLQLDDRSLRRAKWWMRASLGYLVLQFSILARMVWIDFNWDIMEPITYFVGVFTLLLGFSFFVLYGQDYTYHALERRQQMLALRRLYILEEFNWKRWNHLNDRVRTLWLLLGGKNGDSVKNSNKGNF